MISLQKYLFSLIEFKNLAEVDLILEVASANITFWGKRVLKAEGFSGSVAIDQITKKILSVPVVGYYSLGVSQYQLRDKIILRLDELYLESDQVVQNKNCCLNCLAAIRNNQKLRTNVEGQYFPVS